MADDTVILDEEEVDDGHVDDLAEPPALNMTNVRGVIRRKGLIGALSDEGMGPHIHLMMVLSLVVVIAVGVGVVSNL